MTTMLVFFPKLIMTTTIKWALQLTKQLMLTRDQVKGICIIKRSNLKKQLTFSLGKSTH